MVHKSSHLYSFNLKNNLTNKSMKEHAYLTTLDIHMHTTIHALFLPESSHKEDMNVEKQPARAQP